MEIKAYKQGDEIFILDLFKKVYGKDLTSKYWNWRFRDNPFAPPMIELAWDGDILAAHYAVSPVLLFNKGKSELIAHSMTTMTDPSYQGQGLFTKLAQSLYERIEKEFGIKKIFGFPNRNSHYNFVQRLEWKDIYEIPTLSLVVDNFKVKSQSKEQSFKVENFTSIPEKLGSFNLNGHSIRYQLNRDFKYYNWRYNLNPSNEYSCIILNSEEKINAYIIYKEYKTSSSTEIDIVEFDALNERVSYQTISTLVENAKKSSASKINMFMPIHHPLRRSIEYAGFQHASTISYLSARSDEADIFDYRNWNYSQGDSDIF